MFFLVFSFFFVFYGYGDHRDLHVLTHSFPTRRSSDLGSSRARRERIVSAAISTPLPPIAAANASVLPPAPAQRSITVMPGAAAQTAEINWLPASCTSTCPHFQGSLSSTGAPSGRRRASGSPAIRAASG